jgi:hypothetical protein
MKKPCSKLLWLLASVIATATAQAAPIKVEIIEGGAETAEGQDSVVVKVDGAIIVPRGKESSPVTFTVPDNVQSPSTDTFLQKIVERDGSVSDALRYSEIKDQTGVSYTFFSDPFTLNPVQGEIILPDQTEGPGPIELTPVQKETGTNIQQIFVTSDVEAVPEPATVLLVGSAIIGFLFAGRRFGRS